MEEHEHIKETYIDYIDGLQLLYNLKWDKQVFCKLRQTKKISKVGYTYITCSFENEAIDAKVRPY